MTLYMIYTPIDTLENAQTLAHTLIEHTLVVCANILGPMRSVYPWKGSIETSEEYVLVLKTLEPNLKKVHDHISKTHPYEIPCVLTWRCCDVNAPFMAWALGQSDVTST